jgi:hypothetical protein
VRPIGLLCIMPSPIARRLSRLTRKVRHFSDRPHQVQSREARTVYSSGRSPFMCVAWPRTSPQSPDQWACTHTTRPAHRMAPRRPTVLPLASSCPRQNLHCEVLGHQALHLLPSETPALWRFPRWPPRARKDGVVPPAFWDFLHRAHAV